MKVILCSLIAITIFTFVLVVPTGARSLKRRTQDDDLHAKKGGKRTKGAKKKRGWHCGVRVCCTSHDLEILV